MPCAESSRLHAYIDHELDAASHAELERHVAGCAECSAQLTEFTDLRKLIRRSLPHEAASPALRSRIERALVAESAGITKQIRPAASKTWRRPSFWLGALGGVGVTAVSTVVGFFFVAARLTSPLVDEMVTAHVQSLRPDQLIAVKSTDRHTVKPWFAGRADVSPVVSDFAAQGYQLLGGRVDAIAQQRAAVLVYQHGPHVINVFSWVATQPFAPTDTTRNGYHLACWQTGNLDYCAMSDTGWGELRGLERLLRDLGDKEQIDRRN
jgi:anti-sigma factor RsiW